jgi:phosphoribosylformylglycinamidine synthase subunit PurQ / glutaminase
MSKVKALIIRAPGTNCDGETDFAFKLAGAETTLVHVNRLIRREEKLSDYQILAIPGGFSYGDDIAAGKVQANELRLKMGEDVTRFIEDGRLIIGICNGFQVLVKTGFLPDVSHSTGTTVTLAGNDSGKFECRWNYLVGNKSSNCVFTKGIERMYLPIAHGEGKLIAEGKPLSQANIALRYSDENGKPAAGYPDNPNGSNDNIAGICDNSGRVFGLMPHPERHVRATQHPRWTSGHSDAPGDGLKVFTNAVEWASKI